MNPSKVKKQVLSFIIITLASAVYALGFVWCFEPNGIAFGGITGLAQIINYLIPAAPVGVTVIVLNIPLFLLGWRLLGGKLLVGSLYAMFISSIFIDIFTPLWDWQPMEPWLACIFGGLTLGGSLGFVFQQGSTTGGTDLAARLLKLKLAWLPMGKLLMAVDLVVIVLVALTFRTLSTLLYGLVALYISSLAMDGILYGLGDVLDRPVSASALGRTGTAVYAAVLTVDWTAPGWGVGGMRLGLCRGGDSLDPGSGAYGIAACSVWIHPSGWVYGLRGCGFVPP